MEGIKNAGVDLAIFMPAPGEGRGHNNKDREKQRLMLRDLDRSKIKIFCGSYITYWLHEAYHRGYTEEELEQILKRLSKDIDSGEYAGVGEVALYHFKKSGDHKVLQYPPNFEPFLKIIDLIAEKGMWLDLHAEPVTFEGRSYEEKVFGGLELLYQRNPHVKLILSHTAMTNPTNARRILLNYPNIIMNINIHEKHERWKNLEPIVNPKGELYEDWAQLFEEMPERFTVGAGKRPKSTRISKYGKEVKRIRRVLGTLNPKAAKMIAYENAQKIFKNNGKDFNISNVIPMRTQVDLGSG